MVTGAAHEEQVWHAASGRHEQWVFETDVACCAPLLGGDLLLGMRNGLWRFDHDTVERIPEMYRIANELGQCLPALCRELPENEPLLFLDVGGDVNRSVT